MTEDPKQIDTQLDAMIEQAKLADGAQAVGDEEQLVEQIDAMLASGAEGAVAGEFQSVEEVPGAELEAEAAVEPVVQEAAVEAVETDELAGDFESVEDLVGAAPAAEAATEVQQSETNVVDAGPADEGSAEAVATELDAVEQQGVGGVEHVPDLDDDDFADVGDASVEEKGPGAVVRVLAAVNKPVMSWPVFKRDLLGMIGLESALLGLCLLVNVMLGATATMVTAGVGCVVLLVMFYLVFMRQPKVDSATGSGLVIEVSESTA